MNTAENSLQGATAVGSMRLLGSFGVIYADPPWRYDNGGAQGGVDEQYPTMSDEEICALEAPADKNCVLYLWATMPRLPAAIDVIKAWGFEYKTGAAWDKERLGIGYWFRGQHELLLVGVRGKVSPPPAELRIRSVIRAPIGRHSAKPDYVRDQIEKWFPNARRLEMFSRLKRPGWEVFGNQIEYDLLSDVTNEPNVEVSDAGPLTSELKPKREPGIR